MQAVKACPDRVDTEPEIHMQWYRQNRQTSVLVAG